MVVAILTEPSQCHFEYMIVMPYRYKSQELICPCNQSTAITDRVFESLLRNIAI